MSDPVLHALVDLRSYLFEAVYENQLATAEFGKAAGILGGLWEKVRQRPEDFLDLRTVEKEGLDVAAQDFIAGMTDRYAVRLFEELFIPKPWMETLSYGTPKILGLHHVTATVDDAQADLDFCIELLGLRLVKKTVNFDNHNVYHFYYGNEHGEPGTIWTTFPYKGYGVRVGAKGAGQVVTTSFSVPNGSLEFWRDRLRGAGVADQRPRVALRRAGHRLQRSERAALRADCHRPRPARALDRRWLRPSGACAEFTACTMLVRDASRPSSF